MEMFGFRPLERADNWFFWGEKGGILQDGKRKRQYFPAHIWHITHQCHKREFLHRFERDRHRYLQWLYKARKKYGLTILNYMITSNHILGFRAKRREVIEVNDGYLFRERVVPYKPPFGFENNDIGLENTYYLGANAE